MQIVQLIDSLNWGGAQSLLVTFAACAQQRNLDLTIISLRDIATSSLATPLQDFGARLEVFPGHSLSDARRIWKVASYLRYNKSRVLQSHLTYANIIGAVAGSLVRVPHVGTLHNARFNNRPSLHKRIEMWALRYRAQQVVAVGHQSAKVYQRQLGNKKVVIVPNCVAPTKPLSIADRIEIRRKLLGDPERPLLIAVGRLIELKGYDDLITAFARLHSTHSTAALAIAGQGNLYNQLNNQIKALGLTDHVFLLGRRDDVPQLLAAADLFVSASHTEGLPVTLLEAMAAGLPAVATDVGDVSYVLNAETGIIVSPKQPQDLAKALRSMLDNPVQMKAFGRAAKRRVEIHYNPDTWFDQLLTIYEQAMHSPIVSPAEVI